MPTPQVTVFNTTEIVIGKLALFAVIVTGPRALLRDAAPEFSLDGAKLKIPLTRYSSEFPGNSSLTQLKKMTNNEFVHKSVHTKSIIRLKWPKEFETMSISRRNAHVLSPVSSYYNASDVLPQNNSDWDIVRFLYFDAVIQILPSRYIDVVVKIDTPVILVQASASQFYLPDPPPLKISYRVSKFKRVEGAQPTANVQLDMNSGGADTQGLEIVIKLEGAVTVYNAPAGCNVACSSNLQCRMLNSTAKC
eukprot:gene19424-962_t